MHKEKNPLISIILPTYNVAPYLKQCLDSIDSQTYQNYEVIIIIDGATDGSYEIAKDYCENHEKFSAYWQENSGSGPARNAGLAKATGEYIMFVDPDDWIENELLEKLVMGQKEGDYDLVATRRIKVKCDNSGKIIKKSFFYYQDYSLDNQDDVRQAYFKMLRNGVVGSPTQKLYKMSIIREHKIEFPDLRRSQDVVFNYRYYAHIRSLKLLPYSGYNYRVLLQNSSGRSSADYYKIIIFQYNGYKELYESWNMEFPDTDFCTFLFEIRIFANLLRCADQGWDVLPILENETIHHIVSNAKPKSIIKKFVNLLVLKKKYSVMMNAMRMISFFKQKGIVK